MPVTRLTTGRSAARYELCFSGGEKFSLGEAASSFKPKIPFQEPQRRHSRIAARVSHSAEPDSAHAQRACPGLLQKQ